MCPPEYELPATNNLSEVSFAVLKDGEFESVPSADAINQAVYTQKLSVDDLLELAVKMETPSITHKISALKSIDAALNNIQIGLYGLCADCEEQIELERLNNAPTNQRCLACQNIYEKQKHNEYKL